MKPSISVIIPVKNGARFVGEALDSVGRQTEKADEVVVVDGGSTDDTEAVVRRFGWARLVRQSGDGLAEAWNQGVRESSGDAVAFLDSDDRWMPDKLRLQRAWLASHPDCDGVIGRVRFFLADEGACPPGFRRELLTGTHVAHMPGAILARRALFQRVGQFDRSHGVATDIEWFARLRNAGVPVEILPDLLLEKRVHDGNYSYLSAKDGTYGKALLRVLRVAGGIKRTVVAAT